MRLPISPSTVVVTLVIYCIVSEISQIFVLMTLPVFHPNLGVFPLEEIAHVGVNVSIPVYFKLLIIIGREIIFEVFQPI